jgi:purine-binding chemotaxis protein CheW
MNAPVIEADRLFCSFRLDGHLFGVDILDVKEVTTEVTCTRIAHAPSEVMGLVNIRGHIHLALDLRSLLGIPATPLTRDSRLVLFKPTVGHSFGVVVDAISEIHTISPARIETFPASLHEVSMPQMRRVDLISAIGKLPDELLVVLDPRRFLTIVEHNFGRST